MKNACVDDLERVMNNPLQRTAGHLSVSRATRYPTESQSLQGAGNIIAWKTANEI